MTDREKLRLALRTLWRVAYLSVIAFGVDAMGYMFGQPEIGRFLCNISVLAANVSVVVLVLADQDYIIIVPQCARRHRRFSSANVA